MVHFLLTYRNHIPDPREKVDQQGSLMLQAGGHEYPFQYALPHHIPTSFESEDPQFKGSQGKMAWFGCFLLFVIVQLLIVML